jgi:hypothetical protein
MAETQGSPTVGYTIECFWVGLTETELARTDARVAASADAASREGSAVRYLGSLLFPGDEVVFFEFEAESAEAVRAVGEQARIPVERIVRSRRALGPHDSRGGAK